MALVSGGVEYAGTLLMLLQKWRGSTFGTTASSFRRHDTMLGANGRAYRGPGKVCRVHHNADACIGSIDQG